MESILVIILLLATHAAVGTAKEQLKREDPYRSSSSTREINSYCANRISPTSTCCESEFISIYIEGSGTAPCLCRVVAEPHPIMAGLNTTDLLVTFASCRALALGDAPLEATCEGMRLLVVSKVLRIFIVGDQLAIGKETGCLLGMGTNLYPSSALPGQNKDERIGAILYDGTIMTVPKDHIKPSPLLDVWKLAEIITTGMVLHGYLGIMTVIFFWSAYQTKKFTEPTRFITIIIILWVVFSAIHPIQAVSNTKSTPIRKLELTFDAPGYAGWSHDLYRSFTDRTLLEFKATRQKVLTQTYPDEPPEWLHVNVSDPTEWVNFIIRSDNYYVNAFENRQATHSFDEYAKYFPGSIRLGFAGSYAGLNGERKNLTGLELNARTAQRYLQVLSQYKHGVSDPFPMKMGLTTYVLILCEGQRFTEIDTCIRNGWTTTCRLTRTDELLTNWSTLSCAILEGWAPKMISRIKTYERARTRLRITEAQATAQATGLLRVLIIGKACEDNIKGVECVAGNGASCSTSA